MRKRGFFHFWGRSTKHAFTAGWIVFGIVTTALPDLVVCLLKLPGLETYWPVKWVAEHPVRAHLSAAAVAVVCYLAYAPYKLYKERDQKANELEDATSKEDNRRRKMEELVGLWEQADYIWSQHEPVEKLHPQMAEWIKKIEKAILSTKFWILHSLRNYYFF